MKRTAVIALAAMTLTVAGCTTSDPTPPGSLGALSEAEEGDEAEGIPNEEEREEEGADESAAADGEGVEGDGEAEGSEDEADQTEAPKDDAGGGESAESEQPSEGESAEGEEPSERESVGERMQPPTGDDLPDPSEMTDETCIAFFDGAAPLAGRAQDSRFLVSRGAVNNLTSLEFSEVDVLAQRLEELGALGNEEQAELIELINAPFTGVQRAVSDEGGQDAESGEVSYDSLDMDGAEQAQDDFTQGCLPDSAGS